MNPQPSPNSPDALATYFESLSKGQQNPQEIGKLSDLPRDSVRWLIIHWNRQPLEVRRFLVDQMPVQAEQNIELDFGKVLRVAVDDPDPGIRAKAIAGLWEETGTGVLDSLLVRVNSEDEWFVQEQLAIALGHFSYRASIGELDQEHADRVRNALLSLMAPDRHVAVHGRALISLAYLGDDELVHQRLVDAVTVDDSEIQAAALIGMGRQADERWFGIVRNELTRDDPEVRQAATEAMGELGDQLALVDLLPLLSDEDDEVVLAAIRSIGRIGGSPAIQILETYREDADEEFYERIDEAIEYARFESESLDLE